MSARDWQPGDKAYIEVEVEDVTRMSGVDTAFVWVQSTRPGLGRSVGVRVPAADLLPVPQPDEDTIERAHKVVAAKVWEIHGPDSTDMDSAEMDAEDIVAALAAANLLADHDAIRQAKAEGAREALTSAREDVLHQVSRFEIGCEADVGYYDAHMEIAKLLEGLADRIGGE